MFNQTGQSLQSDNLQEILESAKNAADLGSQQFITPAAVADAIALPLPQWRGIAVDLQCGFGDLLTGSKAERVIGCDIQTESVRRSRLIHPTGVFECVDITTLYPLLAETDCRFDLLTLNPPFSLQWHTDKIKGLIESDCPAVQSSFLAVQGRATIESTLATFLIALDRLTYRGEGVMICSQAAAIKMLGDIELPITDTTADLQYPLRKHIWAWITIPSCTLFKNATFDMAVLYFARDHKSKELNHYPVETGSTDHQLLSLQTRCKIIAHHRTSMRRGLTVSSQYDAYGHTAERWDVSIRELRVRRSGEIPKHNLWIEPDGKIGVHLTPFQLASVKLPQTEVKSLWKLKSQFPAALVVQKETRCALVRAVTGGIWTVAPSLIAIVDKALMEYAAVRAPFFPLNDVQRLGFLDEEDTIVCKKDFRSEKHGEFFAGKSYQLTCATRTLLQFEERMNLEGEKDRVMISGCEMVITITDGNQNRFEFLPDPKAEISDDRNGRGRLAGHAPSSNGHDLAALVDHFIIPKVPDIAELFPDKYQAAIAALKEIEIEIQQKQNA